MHQQLSDTYTAIYESYFAKLKSPLALRFFCRFPVPQDLAGHYAAMLASVLFDLANGKLGPHKAIAGWLSCRPRPSTFSHSRNLGTASNGAANSGAGTQSRTHPSIVR